MKHLKRLVLSVVLCLSGCAQLSPYDCRSLDWYALGYSDASLGLTTRQFLVYQNSCAQHGIVPLRTHYLGGWTQARSDGALAFESDPPIH